MKTAENYLDEALAKAATPDENGNCPNLRECFLEAMEAYATQRKQGRNRPQMFPIWANTYFSEACGNLNVRLDRMVVYENFINESGLRWNLHQFTRAMEAWCQHREFIYNPDDMRNPQGRILRLVNKRSVEEDGTEAVTRVVREVIYIDTNNKI